MIHATAENATLGWWRSPDLQVGLATVNRRPSSLLIGRRT